MFSCPEKVIVFFIISIINTAVDQITQADLNSHFNCLIKSLVLMQLWLRFKEVCWSFHT